MTQVPDLINHMLTIGPISRRDAEREYDVQSFHRRLTDIKERGYVLYQEHKKNPVTGQPYTRYGIIDPSRIHVSPPALD